MKLPFQRTKPVPRGHCPEPVVEIDHYGASYRERWDRAAVWFVRGSGTVSFTCRGSHGLTHPDGARLVSEHGGKILDDSADLRLQWSVAPLDGKYYGTRILDADGEEVAEFWDHSTASHPSEREKASFGDWTEEKWADYVCDSHWESERDYLRAKAIVEAMNATLAPPPGPPEPPG